MTALVPRRSAGTHAAATGIPPLENGDRLTREEFERRWQLHPEIKKAELIDGLVFLEMTVSPRHGSAHSIIMGWLLLYRSRHAGLDTLDNGTIRLPDAGDLQPDGALRRVEGGTSHEGDGAIEGPPELVVEIAASSAAYDMHLKKDAYRGGGVREYVVWQVFEERVDWFVLEGDDYVPVPADEQGIIESRQFPGLRLDVPKLLAGDVAGVLAALDA
jgi:Uma2 family endonuclease